MEFKVLIDYPESVKEFMKMPPGLAKNFRYSKLDKVYSIVDVATEGSTIYFSSKTVKLCKSNSNFYFKTNQKQGLTYKDKKLKIWWGLDSINIHHLKELFKYMNWDFIDLDRCRSFITKGVLQRLFQGKITNTRDLLKYYVKQARIDVSPELLYKALQITDVHKTTLYYIAKISKNTDYYLQRLIDGDSDIRYNHELNDLMQQYSILDKKIDFRWSKARIREEHAKATQELMKLEIDLLEDVVISYPMLDYPSEFTPLDTQRKVFEEGSKMNHCIYTNYWTSIKDKCYLAFHVSKDGEEATLGLRIDTTGNLNFNQLYKAGNRAVSTSLKKYCEDWLSTVNKKPIYNLSYF